MSTFSLLFEDRCPLSWVVPGFLPISPVATPFCIPLDHFCLVSSNRPSQISLPRPLASISQGFAPQVLESASGFLAPLVPLACQEHPMRSFLPCFEVSQAGVYAIVQRVRRQSPLN